MGILFRLWLLPNLSKINIISYLMLPNIPKLNSLMYALPL